MNNGNSGDGNSGDTRNSGDTTEIPGTLRNSGEEIPGTLY